MATLGMIEYADAPADVRAVYDDIMETRQTDYINNFWKAMAHDPATLKRTWESIKQIMAPGALDPLTKEMIYLAVSASNQCGYCIASHTASSRKAELPSERSSSVVDIWSTTLVSQEWSSLSPSFGMCSRSARRLSHVVDTSAGFDAKKRSDESWI